MAAGNPVVPIRASASAHSERLAISVGGDEISYGELIDRASRLATKLSALGSGGRVGILATRSIHTYVGILAALWAGKTYVPLNLKWPAARLALLLDELALDALVVDTNGAALLVPEVLQKAPRLIVAPDRAAITSPNVLRFGALAEVAAMAEPAPFAPEQPAYIIFTSGTTGMPKGVVISAAQLAAYLEQTRPWTNITASDRVAETCDATFDLSVHNLFLTLEAGASLHLMRQLELMAPARFVRERAITCWMSVPTVIALMRQTGQLKPDMFPSLRLSIFCGEPLPADLVGGWAAAAPNSVVENIYGPTECTVVCLRQTVTQPPVTTPGRDVVAIGTPYATMDVAVLDGNQNHVPDGAAGEIALSGPQVGIGYFNAPSQTTDRFRDLHGRRWYLTGDLGMRDAQGVFHHLGRVDNQVKIKGNRIELEEVEAHLRQACGSALAAVIAWPIDNGSPQGLLAFVAEQPSDRKARADALLRAMAENLPRYMVPAAIRFIEAISQNINGKIDRKALLARAEEDAVSTAPRLQRA